MEMKTTILILLFLVNLNLYGNNKDSIISPNLKNAIMKGSAEYLTKQMFSKYNVFVIKLISINNKRGCFSISYINERLDYMDVKASNYIYINNKLYLIRADTFVNYINTRYGIPLINDTIKKDAIKDLAGSHISISGQPPSIIIVNFKRRKVKTEYFGSCYDADDRYRL